jgi:glycolate oxidase iron-sulfur subunit
LFETARAEVERTAVLPGTERKFWRWLALEVIFMRPWALRLIGTLLGWYQRSGLEAMMRKVNHFGLLPKKLAELEKQTPKMRTQFSDDLIEPNEAPAKPKYRVGMLTGCMQDLCFSQVNRATVDVLLANDCEVITPRSQYCCGSLHAHNGAVEQAQELARRQIDAFPLTQLDAIITNSGGCGSHLKAYATLLKDDPAYAARARLWDNKVQDIHEWLASIGIRKPKAGCGVERVTYHESCHLCHGQKVVQQPRDILKSIPGVQLVELPESSWCCGSAGIYNITQPEQSEKLLQRKTTHIQGTGCSHVATANPGCHLQLERGLGASVSVTQPVLLLAEAYQREKTDQQ